MTLGEATSETTVEAFLDMDDTFISWCDVRTLQLVPENYPQQIRAMQHCSLPAAQPSISNKMEEECKNLKSFPNVLLNPVEFDTCVSLSTMVGPPVKIHLHPNTRSFAQHTQIQFLYHGRPTPGLCWTRWCNRASLSWWVIKLQPGATLWFLLQTSQVVLRLP